jgi:hypothetical protein
VKIFGRRFVRVGVLIFVTIGLALSAQATGFSNASLKGKYSFQGNGPNQNYWYASITCYDHNGNPYTVSAGGSEVSSQGDVGAMTFDGKGNVTGTFTEYGDFDQAASNATVVPSCTPGQSNNGYAVYDAPVTGTVTGTYLVQSNGTGAMTMTVTGGGGGGGGAVSFVLQLAGTAAVRTTVFLTQLGDDKSPNKSNWFGVAVLQ